MISILKKIKIILQGFVFQIVIIGNTVYKRNSHSAEHKDTNSKDKSKKRKKGEKYEDLKYTSPRNKNSSKKKKTRKYTAHVQHRNIFNLKSPKKTSRDKDKKNISKKKHDKYK